MRLNISKFVFIGVGGIASVFVLLFHFKERNSHQCHQCFSKKHVYQWRLGSWGGAGASIPLTPKWERLEESQFRHQFFAVDHVHDWRFSQGSPYYLFGSKWGGCALGAGRLTSALHVTYESSPEFRAFIQTKLRAGSLTKSNVIAIMFESLGREDTPLQREADALLQAFYSQER
jgi:hypothetical protein